MSELEGKVAVVTGGAQGLGRAIVLRLASEGCDVVVADVDEAQASALASTAAAAGEHRVAGRKVDVTSEADVEALFDYTMETFGRVDIVVANAGILIAEAIDVADAANWRKVIDVNLVGYFLTAKHACRIMKRQRHGAIVYVGSKSGKRGSAANSAYAASKFGGVGLTQSVALEMAPYGVRCNAVCPGNLLDSPLWTDPAHGLAVQYLRAGKVAGAETPDDVLRAYADRVPMKRACTYVDVCNTVVFLASSQAGYITGVAISVTGGEEMN
jgi:sorbitol-6-phosphate 2-dehydrogenase